MFSLKEYLLGDIREAEAGYIAGRTGKGRRTKATPEQIERWNRNKRRRAVRLLIEANFVKGDLWICLKYKKGTHKSVQEVSKDFSDFCRRMRIAYKKEKQAFRWIARIEVGRLGGLHVHLICNAFKGDGLNLIADTWAKASPETTRANVESLDGDPDREQLADYITKEAEKDDDQYHLPGTIKDRRAVLRIRSSRNLIRPEPEKTPLTKREFERLMANGPKPASGFIIIPDSVRRGENPITGMPYIRWKERRIKPISGGVPKREKPHELKPKKEGFLRKAQKALMKIKARFLK